MECRACGRENRRDARFCDGCGAAVEGAAVEAVAPSPVVEGERRQITILFCDLVDSVSLSTCLDPEDFGRLMQHYEEAGQRAVEEFGGHIAQYLGDGLVVYFGYPQAHERAAEMAVRAGLALLENVARLDDQVAESLAVRVGIHTGCTRRRWQDPLRQQWRKRVGHRRSGVKSVSPNPGAPRVLTGESKPGPRLGGTSEQEATLDPADAAAVRNALAQLAAGDGEGSQ